MNKPVSHAAAAAPTQPQVNAAAARPAKAEERQRRLDKLRVLPVLMVVGTLTFGVKLGNIWTDADAIFTGVTAAQAEEEPKPANKAAPAAEPAAADAAGKKDAAGHEAAADAKAGDVNGGDNAAQEAKADARDWDSSEPYSQGELQLLENLADRRKELDERTRELDMRERVLTAMEKRIDDKIGEMKKIEAQVANYLKTNDEQHIQRLKSLVKMYETMKPKDAARIFEQLHMDILVDVASHMKENKMAAVLADMSPDAAKALTVELATKKPIPLASN